MSDDITQRNAQNCKKYRLTKKSKNQGVVKNKNNSENCRQYRQRKKLLAQQLQSKNEVIHTPSTSSLQKTFEPQLITTAADMPGEYERKGPSCVYVTEQQIVIAQALIKQGRSQRAAARAVGISESYLSKKLKLNKATSSMERCSQSENAELPIHQQIVERCSPKPHTSSWSQRQHSPVASTSTSTQSQASEWKMAVPPFTNELVVLTPQVSIKPDPDAIEQVNIKQENIEKENIEEENMEEEEANSGSEDTDINRSSMFERNQDFSEIAPILREMSSTLQIMANKQEDTFESFGKYVANTLRNMPERNSQEMQLQIVRLLMANENKPPANSGEKS